MASTTTISCHYEHHHRLGPGPDEVLFDSVEYQRAMREIEELDRQYYESFNRDREMCAQESDEDPDEMLDACPTPKYETSCWYYEGYEVKREAKRKVRREVEGLAESEECTRPPSPPLTPPTPKDAEKKRKGKRGSEELERGESKRHKTKDIARTLLEAEFVAHEATPSQRMGGAKPKTDVKARQPSAHRKTSRRIAVTHIDTPTPIDVSRMNDGGDTNSRISEDKCPQERNVLTPDRVQKQKPSYPFTFATENTQQGWRVSVEDGSGINNGFPREQRESNDCGPLARDMASTQDQDQVGRGVEHEPCLGKDGEVRVGASLPNIEIAQRKRKRGAENDDAQVECSNKRGKHENASDILNPEVENGRRQRRLTSKRTMQKAKKSAPRRPITRSADCSHEISLHPHKKGHIIYRLLAEVTTMSQEQWWKEEDPEGPGWTAKALQQRCQWAPFWDLARLPGGEDIVEDEEYFEAIRAKSRLRR